MQKTIKPNFDAVTVIHSGRGGRRAGSGRKKIPDEMKIAFQTISVSAKPEQIAELKKQAAAAGQSVSRFLMERAGF